MKTLQNLLLFFSVLALSVSCREQTLVPSELLCEYMQNPEAVDEPSPRLSWYNDVRGGKRANDQTAWQIQVASSRKLLESGEADIWDSGKRMSEKQPFQRYEGPALESAKVYWWRVCVWDSEDRVSSWSKPAYFGTGYMQQEEWKAQWIGSPWEGELPRDVWPDSTLIQEVSTRPASYATIEIQKVVPSKPAPLLRKRFSVDKPLASARLFVCGLGYCEVYLNGEKVGDELLSPNQTDYTDRLRMEERRLPLHLESREMSVSYVGYDLTSLLHQGDNMLGCLLGNGFFNSVHIWTGAYGTPRMIAQLELTYQDGSHETVLSDASWQARESAVRENDVFGGEVYDARCASDDWCLPESSNDGWTQAATKLAPKGMLKAQNGPADRILETVEPISIEKTGERQYTLRFPEEISGRIHLRNIHNAEGDTIRLVYRDGSVADYPYNGQSVYVPAAGRKKESYAPHFTWYVFQEVDVLNWEGDLKPKDALAEVVASDVPADASFHCSNDTLDRLLSIWQRTQKNNIHGAVPSDCPHRERGPYTGDGELACSMILHNFDARSFFHKWMFDIYSAQDSITGYVPNGAPWEPGCGGGVGWGVAMTTIPWEVYLAYGDRDMLESYYEAMKAQTDYMSTWQTPEGTMLAKACGNHPTMNLGEHLPPYEKPTEEAVHTYLWWYCCDIMSKASEVLGRENETNEYRMQANRIAEAYHHRFWNGETGSYGPDEYDLFALYMGVPDSVRTRVVEDLRKQLRNRDGHILTGYMGTRIFFETLSRYGLHEEAFHALLNPTEPSYLAWLKKGATTFWESWDGENSHDHSALGSGLVWLYRYLIGLKTDAFHPGYKRFEIAPVPVDELRFAEYTQKTVYGPLRVRWEKQKSAFLMDIQVPEGCSASLYWPIEGTGPKELDSKGENGEYTLPSGTYRLSSSL